ncbi:response regulator [Candidatus Halobeggiatoa sp. HSG11]|nr:response regulator [Candidatus Halobeggiatoa sp. HSG11]
MNLTKQGSSNDAQPYMPLKYTLMGSFLLLIIPILIAMSVSNYLIAKNDLGDAYEILQQQTENNVINAIKLVNAGYRVLESFLDKEMQNGFTTFIDAYQLSGRNPAKIDLEDIKGQLNDKMDLYIINDKGIVEYTTYTKDLGLDFKKYPETFAFMTKVREDGTFASGGLTSEARTGIIRKYAYMSTPDHKYLLEFGLISNDFADLMGDLDLVKINARLKKLNPFLNQVRIFGRNGNSLGEPDYKPPTNTLKIIETVYDTKKTEHLQNDNTRQYVRYLFVNLKDEKGINIVSDQSKVVELTYNTRLMDESLQRTSSFHFLMSVIAIVLSILVTFIISAWITRPIQSIVKSVDIIADGQLEHKIEAQTNNELKLLKQSITKMVNSILTYANEIEEQNNKLAKLDKLKDDFLSNTSHELRTPINGIIGIADSMIEGATGTLPNKAIKNLSMISFSGRRLANLVNDILDFSKLKHQNIILQSKSIDIKIVTDVVVFLSQPLIGNKDITLVNNITDNNPVNADENRIQQILHNLVGNAIKFTDSGTVEISSTIKDKYMQIIVTDSGVGIQANKLETVFNPFEQADGSIAREFGGTGLGLSITKQLIELHGGEINIESTIDVGTTVSFTLPLSDSAQVDSNNITNLLNTVHQSRQIIDIDDENEEENAAIKNSQIISEHESLHVLIVDDDPINLQVLENQLRIENYAITRANNGQEALDAVNSGTSFAIILLDIMMPKMSGFEVCRIIRETHPPNLLPIIMLTANNQVSDLVEGMQSGANDYLTKPFSKGELITRIRTHVQLSLVNIAYSNFVPLEFLKLLEKDSIVDVRLGDHVQKKMTVLFADIRSFTTLSESMSPKENFEFINDYLGRVSPIIRKYNGFIDKYIGDAIMALFPEQVNDAVQASIEIHKQLILFNQERKQQVKQQVNIGIGIHIGSLMLGTIGEKKRMEGTVISDAVNLASRLEGLTKLYGASTLISGEVLNELPNSNQYNYRFLGKVRVKGKQAPVKVLEIIDSESEEIRDKKIALESQFEQAINAYYRKQFKQALVYFQNILLELPQDKAATFYLERCKYYFEEGIPENWEGIEALDKK